MQGFRRVVLLGVVCLVAGGQQVTMSDISRARDALSRARGLTDAERDEISGLYEQAGQFLLQEVRWKTQSLGHTRTRAVIEGELAAARVAALAPQPAPPPPAGLLVLARGACPGRSICFTGSE